MVEWRTDVIRMFCPVCNDGNGPTSVCLPRGQIHIPYVVQTDKIIKPLLTEGFNFNNIYKRDSLLLLSILIYIFK